MKPVAVREAQEDLETLPDRAFETLHRIGIADFEAFERMHELIRHHQQRCLLKVRDHEQQKMLVSELREHAGIGVREERPVRVAHHRQTVAATQVTRVAAVAAVAAFGPVAVVTILFFEIGNVVRGVGQVVVACAGNEPEPHEVIARQRARVVHAEETPSPACGSTRSDGNGSFRAMPV